MADRVIVIGAGGHASVVIDTLRCTGVEPVALLDDDESLVGTTVADVPVVGSFQEIASYPFDSAIVGIGNNDSRAELSAQLDSSGLKIVSAIHPAAVVSPSASVGRGTLVCAGAIVNPHAEVGEGVILNTACTVDHHCRIASYCHIAPGSHLGGNCEVGFGALVGLGTSVLPGISIGEHATVGAGSVVVHHVEQRATVVGNPAMPRPTGK